MSKLFSPKVLVPVAILVVLIIVYNLLALPGMVLPEISIPAEAVFDLFGFPITNTLLAAWLAMLILILGSWAITRRLKPVPGRWQGFLEMIIEGFYRLVERAAGPKWTPRFFPIVMTLFLFIVTSNWLGLTPLYSGWGVLHHAEEEGHPVTWLNEAHTVAMLAEGEEEQQEGETTAAESGDQYILVPAFRAATTDLNFTLALALVSVGLTQWFGLRTLGRVYAGKFIAVGGIAKAFRPNIGCGGRIAAFFMGIIDLFLGIVELISELGKVVSFSFRLFGNIFAGEVLLAVMAFLVPYLISLPFYGLEIFVGLVQGLVFMMLTVAFFIVAVTHHGAEH